MFHLPVSLSVLFWLIPSNNPSPLLFIILSPHSYSFPFLLPTSSLFIFYLTQLLSGQSYVDHIQWGHCRSLYRAGSIHTSQSHQLYLEAVEYSTPYFLITSIYHFYHVSINYPTSIMDMTWSGSFPRVKTPTQRHFFPSHLPWLFRWDSSVQIDSTSDSHCLTYNEPANTIYCGMILLVKHNKTVVLKQQTKIFSRIIFTWLKAHSCEVFEVVRYFIAC